MIGFVRTGPLAAIALVAGCLHPSSHECPGGWVCPADLQCAAAPTYCGVAMQVDKCSGKSEWDPCPFADGDPSSGSCRGGVCEMCTADREGCAGPNAGWFGMTSPVASDLLSITVVKRGEAYAVGQAGTLLGYDGTQWAPVATTPPLPSDALLTSVWASSGDDIYIASNNATYGVMHVGPQHAMTMVAMPAGADVITAIAGSAPDDVYAVGLSGTICHYDGTSWTLEHGAPGPTFDAVSTAGGGKALAASQTGFIGTRDTSGWTIAQSLQAPATTASLKGAWQSSTEEYVVGPSPQAGMPPVVGYYAGGWMLAQTGLQSRQLYGVWGTAEAIHVVGNAGLLLRTTDRQTWTSVTMPPTHNDLQAVAGSSASDVFVVGRGGVILRSLGD